MKISEVAVTLISNKDNKLKAFCSISTDNMKKEFAGQINSY